ncbi:MAG: nucleotide exchange factor GrpE [Nitrospirae bacterium]|nr:MAG: nucleotide exchange factor GrpE [Nitrospirota bacterium]
MNEHLNQQTESQQQHGRETVQEVSPTPVPPVCEKPSDQSSKEEGETVETLREELEKKTQELRSLNDKYLRLAAEFENYKRRVQRDHAEAIRFGTEKLLRDLLPTLDNLERAIKCGREQMGLDGLLEGVELTYKQFLDTLSKVGVTQIVSVGEPFDPAKHQAIGQVESSSMPADSVVEEFQKGYFLHERILRPAMVTVAKPSEGPGPSPHQEEGSPGKGGEHT